MELMQLRFRGCKAAWVARVWHAGAGNAERPWPRAGEWSEGALGVLMVLCCCGRGRAEGQGPSCGVTGGLACVARRLPAAPH